MAKDDPQTLCERLFETFLAPLVLGGQMAPRKLIGGKAAFAIENRVPSNDELLSRTKLTRIRVARKLSPIDTLEAAPSSTEWILAAALHDIVQSTHPEFDTLFRRRAPTRILDVVEATLDRIPPPSNVGDALSRHTWFSRMFELTRTDVDLQWWTGSQRFLGSEPPKRLMLWPDLRRVNETRTPRPLMDLPTSGSAVDAPRFTMVIEGFLRKTPLTDLASMTRTAPLFRWSHENLSLISTFAGRTMASRALALLPSLAVDVALGRATRQLFATHAVRALLVAIDLLRDRALATASTQLAKDEPSPLTADTEQEDAAFAMGVGALAASHWLAENGRGFREAEKRTLLDVLAPLASSRIARDVKALLG